MARGAPAVETCPTCGVTFTGSPRQRNGQGSWKKECPAGHWHTLHELARTRNADQQAARHVVMAKTKEVGIRTDIDAMRLALASMLGGYERLLATTPERSRPVIAGAFGKSPEVCKQILESV
jgi:hypothetical protein